MAENTVPFSIEEAPAPISDDVAVQATPYMDALTIPDTDKPAAFRVYCSRLQSCRNGHRKNPWSGFRNS